MRKIIVLGAMLVAGCEQQQPTRNNEDLQTFDTAEAPPQQSGYPTSAVPAAPPPPPVAPPPTVRAESGSATQASADVAGGPNIGVTAAPGVAFNYRYAFRLPNARIAPVQEAHAVTCEKLTIARCRITGMRYSLVNERDIAASLEMKLDPAIARQFGKDATKLVVDSEGMLVDLAVAGVDVGSSIDQADRGQAELQDELDRVNRELSRPGLSNVIRDRLLSEAQALRAQIRALGEQKRVGEESLATTPIAFHYGSGQVVPGFDEPAPLADAIDRAGYNFKAALGTLIVALAAMLPWLLLIFAVWFVARRFGLFRWAQGGSYREENKPVPELREPLA